MASSVKVIESRFVQSCTSIANAPQILSAEIAILGRSNVGKSSLINALLNNKNLAKSSATPGKTRLVNFFESKWKVESVDFGGNSSLELHSADFGIFGASQTPSLVSAPKIPKSNESQTENPSVVDSTQGVESSKKIKIKEHIKSFCYFWLSPKVESHLPLNPNLPIAQSAIKSHTIQGKQIANDSRIAKMDSSLRTSCYAQNDESNQNNSIANANSSIVSEKSGLCSHERGNKTKASIDEASGKLHDLSPQDEFAQEFAIHIIDFPGFGYAKVSKTERDSWDKNLSTFLKKRESIKLFIHLIDSRHTNLPLDDEIRAFLRSNLRADADILEVFTKADKLKKSEIRALKGKILVSVTKKDLGQRDFKDSIESLRHAILRTMYHI